MNVKTFQDTRAIIFFKKLSESLAVPSSSDRLGITSWKFFRTVNPEHMVGSETASLYIISLTEGQFMAKTIVGQGTWTASC